MHAGREKEDRLEKREERHYAKKRNNIYGIKMKEIIKKEDELKDKKFMIIEIESKLKTQEQLVQFSKMDK